MVLECPYCRNPIQVRFVRVDKKLSIDEIKKTLGQQVERLEITEDEDAIKIMPKNYLGKEVWQSVNDALKPFKPEWMLAGKQSKWVIKR